MREKIVSFVNMETGVPRTDSFWFDTEANALFVERGEGGAMEPYFRAETLQQVLDRLDVAYNGNLLPPHMKTLRSYIQGKV